MNKLDVKWNKCEYCNKKTSSVINVFSSVEIKKFNYFKHSMIYNGGTYFLCKCSNCNNYKIIHRFNDIWNIIKIPENDSLYIDDIVLALNFNKEKV